MRPFQKVVRSLRRRQNITTAGEYLFRIFIMIMILFDLFVAVYAGTVNQKMELFLFSIALRIITALLIIYLILKANHLLIDDFQAARYLDVWNADKTDTYQNAVELLGNTSASEIILERIFHRADLRTREQKMTPDNSGLKLVMLVFLTLLIANLSLLLLAPYTMAQAYDFYKLNHLPAVVHKQFVEVTPGDLQITLNSDVVIEVVDPEPEVDHVLFYKRGENWREEKLIDHKRRFVNVDFSFLYYVRTPYAASDTFAVQVFEIPAIRNIDLLYDYPAYTDLADYLEENSSGNIKALRNTRVTLDISANNPITTADIVFSQGTLGTLTRTGRSSFRYSFLIAENGSYHINLVDILQNRSRKITRSITAIPDRQPEIKIIYPGRDTLLNQNMLLPLKIQAADDFGLQDLKLYYHVNDEPQDIISIVKYISSNLLDLEYQFDLSEIFLIPGDRITYWTAISDNSPEIQTATSNKYMVRFPSIEEIYHEIEEEERIKSEILQNTWEKSQELREDYEEIRRDLLKKDELDWEDRKQLEDLLNKQQNLNQDIMKMAQDYQELIDKFRDNQALSQETLEKMDKIKDLMEEIASEELLQAMEKLRESLESVDPETWRKAMEDFRFSLEDFSQKLDQTIDLLEQIKKEQAMQKSLEIAEEMEEMQNKLNERTANQEADNQQLAQEQQNIRDKLQSLQEQLEKTSALLDQEKDQEVLEAMEELMQQMDRDSLDQDLQESQQNLMENQNQKAQESQQNASHKMQNMTARLSQMQQMLSSGFMMEVTAIIDDSIKRLLIFSYEQERSSLSFSGDPYTILATQIANFEGINLTLQKLYSVPMIVLVLGPKFIFDANLTLAAYRELFQYINEAGRIRLNTYLDNIQKGINLMIYDLLQAGSNMQGGGGGMQSLMQALQQMGQQQMLLNMATQQLLQQMGEEGRMSGDMMTEARRLARDEERLAENLKRALQNDPEAQKQTAALNQIIEDLQSISRNLQQGILNQEMIDLQDRILSRLLDAQKSVHKREFSRQRKSEISDIDQWELPEDIKLKFDKMRQKALLNEEYKKYPQEYQELIREYLRLLNEKIDEKQ